MTSMLKDRVVGETGISIATDLAILGLYNRHPDGPRSRTLPATLGQILYINVRTLFRNIYGSAAKVEDAENTSVGVFFDLLEQELSVITDVLEMQEPPLKVVFYAPSYDSLKREYRNGELKDIKTDKITHKTKVENQVLELLEKHYRETNLPIIFNDLEIRTNTPYKAFFLTHYPVDLLHTKGFDKVYLIESHTGVVKGPEKWWTKLATKNLEHAERIPFNKATIQFFGDTGNMFKSQPIKAKKRVAEIAEKYKWNQTTTKDRILGTLKLSFEGSLEMTFRKLW